MKQNRVDRIMAALKEVGLHQMLIVDPMSIYYLTGVYVSPFERFYGLYLREDGHHAFFLNRLFTVPQEVGIERYGIPTQTLLWRSWPSISTKMHLWVWIKN